MDRPGDDSSWKASLSQFLRGGGPPCGVWMWGPQGGAWRQSEPGELWTGALLWSLWERQHQAEWAGLRLASLSNFPRPWGTGVVSRCGVIDSGWLGQGCWHGVLESVEEVGAGVGCGLVIFSHERCTGGRIECLQELASPGRRSLPGVSKALDVKTSEWKALVTTRACVSDSMSFLSFLCVLWSLILTSVAELGNLPFREHLLCPGGSRGACWNHGHVGGAPGHPLREGVSGSAAAAVPQGQCPSRYWVTLALWFPYVLLPTGQVSSGSPLLWLPASLTLVLCLCRLLGFCFLGVLAWADLRDVVGSVLDYCNKAGITIKWVTWIFLFSPGV